MKFMKTLEIFSFISMHVVTKNHRFLTDICEKNFHGSLILLQNTKNILFGKYLFSDIILFKTDFENKLKENFCKNTSKKDIFLFTRVFANLSYDSFSKSF